VLKVPLEHKEMLEHKVPLVLRVTKVAKEQ
jgi:hypothetical protein